MGEHKVPKQTARVDLSPVERLHLFKVLADPGVFKVKDRDTERRLIRTWDAIGLDAIERTPNGDGQTVKLELKEKPRRFDLTGEALDFLIALPISEAALDALVMGRLRDKLEAAREQLRA